VRCLRMQPQESGPQVGVAELAGEPCHHAAYVCAEIIGGQLG
jgi:hypothetical protein